MTLIRDAQNTDITDYALSKLADSKVRKVFLIGRRGPLQVAFTIKEFREILKLPNVQTIIDENYLEDAKTVLPGRFLLV